MASPRRARKEATKIKVLASDVARSRSDLASLLVMSKDCPVAMQGPIQDIELERSMPMADEIVMAEMTLPQKHDYLMIMRTTAQRALAAMAPRAVWKMAKKIEDETEPGNVRLLVEYLRGMGFFEPSTPLTDEERERKMAKHAEYEKMALEDLKAAVLGGRS